MKKTDFDNNLENLNKKVTSNKTKHVLIENQLNELLEKVKLLSAKDYNFFEVKLFLQVILSRKIYFLSTNI